MWACEKKKVFVVFNAEFGIIKGKDFEMVGPGKVYEKSRIEEKNYASWNGI